MRICRSAMRPSPPGSITSRMTISYDPWRALRAPESASWTAVTVNPSIPSRRARDEHSSTSSSTSRIGMVVIAVIPAWASLSIAQFLHTHFIMSSCARSVKKCQDLAVRKFRDESSPQAARTIDGHFLTISQSIRAYNESERHIARNQFKKGISNDPQQENTFDYDSIH